MMRKLAILFIATLAFGQYDSENFDFVASLVDGSVESICATGDYVFLGEGSSLNVVDVSDPTNPHVIGSEYLPGLIEAICIRDERAYIANGDLGFYIVNVENPERPLIMGYTDSMSNAVDVVSDGDYAYVVSDYRLHIVDVRDPYSPRIVHSMNTPERANAVTISGNTLYFTYGFDGIRIVDISTPESPVVLSNIDVINIDDLAVWDDKLFARSTASTVKMRYYNVSDPEAPVQIEDSLGGFHPTKIFARDGRLYATSSEHLVRIYDIADTLELLGEMVSYGGSYEVFANGDFVYSVGSTYGFNVIDASDPSSPEILGSFPTGDHFWTVQVEGNRCYFASGLAGVTIVDISDFDSTEIIGVYRDTEYCLSVTVRDSIVFIADATAGFKIVDMTDIESPVLLSEIDGSYTRHIELHDTLLFLSDNSEGIRIFNISDLEAPVEIGSFDTEGRSYLSVYEEGLLYVADGGNGLVILDVTDPTAPELLSTMDFTTIIDIALDGQYIYAACDRFDLNVINVGDPTDPFEVERYYTSSACYGVSISENILYLAVMHSGVQAFDITDPLDLLEVGHFNTQGYGRDVYAMDSLCFVADGDGGGIVLKYDSYTATPYIINLHEGWNMLGYPFLSPFATTLLPVSVIDPVFTYNPSTGGYDEATHLRSGKGHWILASEDTTWEVHDMESIDNISIVLRAGWNMISGPYAEIPASTLAGYSEIVMPIFGFNPETGGYEEIELMNMKKGYWVLAADDVEITLP